MSWTKGVCRLLRLPLFVTPVADSMAAYLVATLAADAPVDWSVLPLLAGTSAGLYLFGMVENDLVDVRRDRHLRLPRPLVTGEVGLPTAVALLLLTAALAAFCAAGLPAAALLAVAMTFGVINLYNLGAKFGPAYVAMPVMGLCRLLNCGIGVAVAVGIPHGILTWKLLTPMGPLWFRHAVALGFAAAMITGYSISARRGASVSTGPWRFALFFVVIVALVNWQVRVLGGAGFPVVPPLTRTLPPLLLPFLWPGGIRLGDGSQRQPAQYAKFIERTIYWLILLDAAFVADAALLGPMT